MLLTKLCDGCWEASKFLNLDEETQDNLRALRAEKLREMHVAQIRASAKKP